VWVATVIIITLGIEIVDESDIGTSPSIMSRRGDLPDKTLLVNDGTR
jgi:hypothetical protein